MMRTDKRAAAKMARELRGLAAGLDDGSVALIDRVDETNTLTASCHVVRTYTLRYVRLFYDDRCTACGKPRDKHRDKRGVFRGCTYAARR